MKKLIFLILLTFFLSCDKDEPEPILNIGDYYQGGIIAYILQPGDPGYDPKVQHGLIASPDDLSGESQTSRRPSGLWVIQDEIQWNNMGSLQAAGATGTAIGTGYQNTMFIINKQGSVITYWVEGVGDKYRNASYAAKWCYDLVLNNYNDWYLPSKDELNKLYINRELIGGFTDRVYWSSSESDSIYSGKWDITHQEMLYGKDGIAYYAFAQYFKNLIDQDTQAPNYKGNLFRVRAVRSF